MSERSVATFRQRTSPSTSSFEEFTCSPTALGELTDQKAKTALADPKVFRAIWTKSVGPLVLHYAVKQFPDDDASVRDFVVGFKQDRFRDFLAESTHKSAAPTQLLTLTLDKYYSERQAREFQYREVPVSSSFPDPSPSPRRQALENDMRLVVHALLSYLGTKKEIAPITISIIQLSFLDGISAKEVAKHLLISPEEVNSQKRKFLPRLQRYINKNGEPKGEFARYLDGGKSAEQNFTLRALLTYLSTNPNNNPKEIAVVRLCVLERCPQRKAAELLSVTPGFVRNALIKFRHKKSAFLDIRGEAVGSFAIYMKGEWGRPVLFSVLPAA